MADIIDDYYDYYGNKHIDPDDIIDPAAKSCIIDNNGVKNDVKSLDDINNVKLFDNYTVSITHQKKGFNLNLHQGETLMDRIQFHDVITQVFYDCVNKLEAKAYGLEMASFKYGLFLLKCHQESLIYGIEAGKLVVKFSHREYPQHAITCLPFKDLVFFLNEGSCRDNVDVGIDEGKVKSQECSLFPHTSHCFMHQLTNINADGDVKDNPINPHKLGGAYTNNITPVDDGYNLLIGYERDKGFIICQLNGQITNHGQDLKVSKTLTLAHHQELLISNGESCYIGNGLLLLFYYVGSNEDDVDNIKMLANFLGICQSCAESTKEEGSCQNMDCCNNPSSNHNVFYYGVLTHSRSQFCPLICEVIDLADNMTSLSKHVFYDDEGVDYIPSDYVNNYRFFKREQILKLGPSYSKRPKEYRRYYKFDKSSLKFMPLDNVEYDINDVNGGDAVDKLLTLQVPPKREFQDQFDDYLTSVLTLPRVLIELIKKYVFVTYS